MNKLLFICSPSYSGSTLLTILLDEHPEIATLGELKASAFGDIYRYECSCGQLLRECTFFRQLEAQVKVGSGLDFSVLDWRTHFVSSDVIARRLINPMLKGPGFELLRRIGIRTSASAQSALAETTCRNRALINATLHMNQASVFLDGSKDPIRAKYLIDTGAWDVRVILLVRDGRGVTHSYMRHEGVSMDYALEEWKKKISEMHRLASLVGTGSMVVRYEDLCSAPLDTLNGILDFAGLTRLQQLNFPILHENRHILGNAMRLRDIESVQVDEKWRTGLPEQDLQYFYQRAGRINEGFGYPTDSA